MIYRDIWYVFLCQRIREFQTVEMQPKVLVDPVLSFRVFKLLAFNKHRNDVWENGSKPNLASHAPIVPMGHEFTRLLNVNDLRLRCSFA